MKNKERVIYLDLLRILAIFAVILLHVNASVFVVAPLDLNWQFSNIYGTIVRFCVPALIMISGIFLLDKNIDTKKLYTHNIARLLVAYLVWCFIYALYRSGNPFSVEVFAYIKAVAINFLNHNYHLWFMPVIIGLYIATPLIRAIVQGDNGKRNVEYLLILFLGFKIVIQTICSVVVIFFPGGELISTSISRFQPPIISGFIGYYVLGYYLYKYNPFKNKEKLTYILAFIGIIVGIISTYLISTTLQSANTVLYDYFSLPTFLLTIGLFTFFQTYISKFKFSKKQIISKISNLTFGIYLVHALIITLVFEYLVEPNSFSAALSIPLLTTVVFVISLLIAWLISKIPILKKYII